VGGAFSHSSPAARRAEASPFATQGNELFMVALAAHQAHETLSENAAIQIALELVPDETRDLAIAETALLLECRQMALDCLVQHRLFRLPARVARRIGRHAKLSLQMPCLSGLRVTYGDQNPAIRSAA